VRPALDGKRLPGEVEIHQNGLRYMGHQGHKIGWSCYENSVLQLD
jgi:nucleosome binding factor SPN SPT16 subunit